MAASTLQLEFSQAMSDFKKMFPDIDREVIEAVLRANSGAVDQTIDMLLAMSTDNQNEKLRNELDANSTTPTQPTVDSLINNHQIISDTNQSQLGQADTIDGKMAGANLGSVLLNLGSGTSPNHHNTGASPKQRPLTPKQLHSNNSTRTPTKRPLSHNVASGAVRRWNPPMLGLLPTNFLRVTPTAGQQDFELPDEQFALMLQNEEFMNQLRWNQDFMTALEKEQSSKAKGDDDAAFKERLKNMGKISRKKFLQMARVFTWQRNKKTTTAKQIDSLPLKEEPSDDEEHHHQQQHSQSGGQGQGQLQLRK